MGAGTAEDRDVGVGRETVSDGMAAPASPTPEAAAALDERDAEPRTPMRRLGSTRKLAAFSNIRLQLAEQSRVVEGRAEAAAGVAGELGDYCRRRADLEHDYARALDKLARAAQQRHKDHKHKREQWPLTGAFACWQAALEQTRALARDHAALADLYAGPLAARLQRAADDALRLHRKCRDIVAERHEELGAALCEAGAAGKAHAAAAAEWRAAALKLRHARDQRDKLAAADPPRPKKVKALDKELEKRRARHSEARARALRARADYALGLEAANATLQRYYLDDVADIMLCAEVGFEAVVGRATRTAAAAEGARATAARDGAGALLAAAEALDALADRQRVVAAHAAAFAPPRPLPWRGAPPDALDADVRDLLAGAADDDDAAAQAVRAELAARLVQLDAAARRLRVECREAAKTLDAAEAELVRQMEGGEIDVSALFGPGAAAAPPPPPAEDEAPRRDQEDYYLAKFRSYVSCAGRLARLESKAAAVRSRLLGAPGAGAGGDGGSPARLSPPSPPRRAALRRGLFAAPLGERLPTVLTSCVRVIAAYGRRHQGVFRVSGSQVEMQALRAAFERGDDPLARVRDASDINSVCGLLKLYLRSLRPPLVPPPVAERLLRVAAHYPPQSPASSAPPTPCAPAAPSAPPPEEREAVGRLREALAALPPPNMLVLRYLTAFLAHLTEYSEQNMMDAWNLAICLGPTLLAAGGEGGAQVAAQNLVNELVKRMILHHAAVFPQDVAPHALYARLPEAEPGAEAEPGDEADGEGPNGPASGDAAPDDDDPDDPDEPDADADADADPRDDLSLYADDDEGSSDGDSGEWRAEGAEGAEGAARGSRSASGAESAPRTPSQEALPRSARAQTHAQAQAAPDLVLGLPLPDPADAFAHNQHTLKKRPHRHAESESDTAAAAAAPERCGADAAAPPPEGAPSAGGAPPEGAAEAGQPEEGAEAAGSPVPLRNTARVAAKFAELTLTGGSLKPALAAKPALLRRPTPHPHHARPSPDH